MLRQLITPLLTSDEAEANPGAPYRFCGAGTSSVPRPDVIRLAVLQV
jgi:hypothetical protein